MNNNKKVYGDLDWAVLCLLDGKTVCREGGDSYFKMSGDKVFEYMAGRFYSEFRGKAISEFKELHKDIKERWYYEKDHERYLEGTWLQAEDGRHVQVIGWLRDLRSYVLKNHGDDHCWAIHHMYMNMFKVIEHNQTRLNKVSVCDWTIETDSGYVIEAVNRKKDIITIVIDDTESEYHRYIEIGSNKIMILWDDNVESEVGDYTFKMTTEEVDGRHITKTSLSRDVEHLDSCGGIIDLYLYGTKITIDNGNKKVEVRDDYIDTGVV